MRSATTAPRSAPPSASALHLNTDWGTTSKNLFIKAAQSKGAQIAAVEGFLPGERDLRSTLVRIREANPTGLILECDYADAANIARQVRDLGMRQPIAAVGSVYSPKLLELGGTAVNGTYTQFNFFPDDLRPEVQAFVKRFAAKYGREPDGFNATAYDTIILFGQLVKQFGATREAIQDGLGKIKDVPSVVYGKITFDPKTRLWRSSGRHVLQQHRPQYEFRCDAQGRRRDDDRGLGQCAGCDRRRAPAGAHRELWHRAVRHELSQLVRLRPA